MLENGSSNMLKSKKAKLLLVIVFLLVLLIGGNIYASTKGYENIFFMIKYIVTGENVRVTDKNEILSDKEITISFEPIKLNSNIRMLIKKLQVKDNKAKLFLVINDELSDKESSELTPLKYEVYNSSNELLCKQDSKKDSSDNIEYTEELVLDNFNENDNILILKVFSSKNEKITQITINLLEKSITVEEEIEALKKISEEELRKYLGFISIYEESDEKNTFGTEDWKIFFAEAILSNINGYSPIKSKDGGWSYKVSDVNNVLDAIGYGKVSEKHSGKFFKATKIDDIDCFEPVGGFGGMESNTVIDISDLSYNNGEYTAKFSYSFINQDIAFEGNNSNLDKKVATVVFKLNENNEYSRFKVLKYEINNDDTDNTSSFTTNNSATSNNEKTNTSSNDTVKVQTINGAGYSATLSNDEIKITLKSQGGFWDDSDFIGSINNKTYFVSGIDKGVKKIVTANRASDVSPEIFVLMNDGTVNFVDLSAPIIAVEFGSKNPQDIQFKNNGKVTERNDIVDIKENNIVVSKSGEEIDLTYSTWFTE